MERLANIRNAIWQFFYSDQPRVSGYYVSFFRVAIGLLTLVHFVSIFSDFALLFSKQGIIPWDITNLFLPEYLITLPKIVIYFEGLGMAEATTVLLFQIVFIVVCLALILGVYSRFSALLLLFLHLAYIKASPLFAYGIDFFTSMSLFYLVVFPDPRQLTLDSYWRKPRTKEINYRPYKRMFQIHVGIVYFFSGLIKILGFNWRNGEAIWKSFNLPYANMDFNIDFSWMAQYPIILIVMGWATVLIELLYPVFISIPYTRRVWLSFTFVMHIGIAAVLNLYFFAAIMIVWNLTGFWFSKPENAHATNTEPLEKLDAMAPVAT